MFAIDVLLTAEIELNKERPSVAESVREILQCSITNLLMDTTSALRTILLIILYWLIPSMSGLLQSMTPTPLASFTSPDSVLSYIEAVIQSGFATDAHREMLYILGNTSVGKTSLAETLKRYIHNPGSNIEPFLTEEHKHLEKTRVAEINKDTTMHGGHIPLVELERDEGGKFTMVHCKNENNELSMGKALLKIIDFGGHQALVVTLFSIALSSNFAFQETSSRKYNLFIIRVYETKSKT